MNRVRHVAFLVFLGTALAGYQSGALCSECASEEEFGGGCNPENTSCSYACTNCSQSQMCGESGGPCYCENNLQCPNGWNGSCSGSGSQWNYDCACNIDP